MGEHDNTIHHNGVGHHPLVAGSYYWQKDVVNWLYNHVEGSGTVNVFIGVQPNSSPHMGTLTTVGASFIIAKRLQDLGKTVRVYFDAVDTAPATGSVQTINGVVYQKSMRHAGNHLPFLDNCREILETFSRLSGVSYVIRRPTDMLSHPAGMAQLREIIKQRDELEQIIGRQGRGIGLRATCPTPRCGLADKVGLLNLYLEDSIVFHCPEHGRFALSLLDPKDTVKIELNTPLRSLLRHRVFRFDYDQEWIEILGADFSGFYNEQLLWRPLSSAGEGKHPKVLYTPLIVDWSGAKLSKSLYVRDRAYDYLTRDGLDYMLSYKVFKETGLSLEAVYNLCDNWIANPYKLFRCYTIYHMNNLLQEEMKRLRAADGAVVEVSEKAEIEAIPVTFPLQEKKVVSRANGLVSAH